MNVASEGAEIVENMTDYQYAWGIYLAGSLGCCLATWLLFRRAGRPWIHFFVISVMVLLLTPYAIDAEKMTMAPAVLTLVFGFLTEGFVAVKPVIKLMLGIWLGALVLSLIYQLLTRGRGHTASEEERYPREEREHQTRRSARGLSPEEHHARDELLRGEEPIRATR